MEKGSYIATESAAGCAEIQAGMLAICKKFFAETGLSIESAGWRGPGPGPDFAFHLTFRVAVPATPGRPKAPKEQAFAQVAGHYGLKPDDLGREFSIRGERFRIIGIDPRRSKYPIAAERLSNSGLYKFPSDEVVRQLAEETIAVHSQR